MLEGLSKAKKMKPEFGGVVAFAFGAPWNILANWRIADIATLKARELGFSAIGMNYAMIFTQWDIRIDIPDWMKSNTVYIEEEPKSPPPILRIARWAVQAAKKRGLKELWVVAARPHLRRCIRDTRFAIREADAQIKVRICEEIFNHPREEWFCSESTQERVRSFWKWWPRERILLAMPMWLYKRVAG